MKQQGTKSSARHLESLECRSVRYRLNSETGKKFCPDCRDKKDRSCRQCGTEFKPTCFVTATCLECWKEMRGKAAYYEHITDERETYL